jgi:hypothetical protein
MIVLRKIDGSTCKLPDDAKFVELVNEFDGSIMAVFFQAQPGMLLKIAPGTSDAARYEVLFGKHGAMFSGTSFERQPQP